MLHEEVAQLHQLVVGGHGSSWHVRLDRRPAAPVTRMLYERALCERTVCCRTVYGRTVYETEAMPSWASMSTAAPANWAR
ncbi:hypothetical protein GCM10025862_38390 [Arsenicicoccus piscis]|uniref:Uncharacterized protein n=1 Tax=Arsenicicoccus piscis TaxID=673954 RepID=A0ABQ6HVU9_9MICO|nr:hypothetical protein GCM10025862_38390 [Arsenicicoccus piscis]